MCLLCIQKIQSKPLSIILAKKKFSSNILKKIFFLRSKKPAFARIATDLEMSSDVFYGRASELHPLCRLQEAQTYLSRLVATSLRVRQCSPLPLVSNFLALLGTSRDEGSNSAVSSPQVSLSSLDGEHPCPQVSHMYLSPAFIALFFFF